MLRSSSALLLLAAAAAAELGVLGDDDDAVVVMLVLVDRRRGREIWRGVLRVVDALEERLRCGEGICAMDTMPRNFILGGWWETGSGLVGWL